MAIQVGQPLSYNGINIAGASYTFAFDPVRDDTGFRVIAYDITIEGDGYITSITQLSELNKPKGDLTFVVGGIPNANVGGVNAAKSITILPKSDMTNGPYGKASVVKWYGFTAQKLNINIKFTFTARVSDLGEKTINKNEWISAYATYKSSVNERGLTTLATSIDAVFPLGAEADKFRTELINTFIGAPVGSYVRKVQEYSVDRHNSHIRIDVTDTETFAGVIASPGIVYAKMELSFKTNGTNGTRSINMTINPNVNDAMWKTKCKNLFKDCVDDFLMGGIDTSTNHLLENADIKWNSEEGTVTANCSIMIPAIKKTSDSDSALKDTPTPQDIADALFGNFGSKSGSPRMWKDAANNNINSLPYGLRGHRAPEGELERSGG